MEELARAYLQNLGFHDIRYEPDGNVPPDFLIDGRIAVEVRRLNQHAHIDESPIGLEDEQFSMLGRIRGLLSELGQPNKGVTWFLNFRFERPVERWKTLRPRLRTWLQAFRDGPQTAAVEQKFGGGFQASLIRASKPHEQLYILGGFIDHNAGGWLLHELRQNLRLCIAEKSRKTASFRDRYPEWWLVLIDQIGYALNEYERDLFRSDVPGIGDWDRVVIVSPLDPAHAYTP